jgi:hypothetical protein
MLKTDMRVSRLTTVLFFDPSAASNRNERCLHIAVVDCVGS